jgi:WS/DGAT/MGAT family acyltransferase
MALHPMSPLDAAWFHMDGPANRAIVTGLLLTTKPLDFVQVRAQIGQRITAFERFRQRVVERGLAVSVPYWQDVEPFDPDLHLHHVALPAPRNAKALTAFIADIASTRLDPAQPLWQVHLVERVDRGSALLMRLHHCLADGTAMMGVMSRLFDPVPTSRRRAAPVSAGLARPQPAPAASMVDHAVQLVAGAGMLLQELLKQDDPPSPLKGEFGPRQQVGWSRPVAIADVKAIGARHGAKVNDVLVACFTGALRGYLRRRGVDVDHTTVRAMVPVDLRSAERIGELGNEFGLVILDLAVTSSRRAQRLALTKARMDALKHSAEPVAMKLLLDLFGRTPKVVEDAATDLFGAKASLVMTNVAGPRETLSLAGVPVDRAMFWVPHPGRQLGLGASILSYAGTATLAVISDAHLVPDPEEITRRFDREFEAMARDPEATTTTA